MLMFFILRMMPLSQQYLAINGRLDLLLLGQFRKLFIGYKVGQKEGSTVLFSSKSNGNSIIIITIWDVVRIDCIMLTFGW